MVVVDCIKKPFEIGGKIKLGPAVPRQAQLRGETNIQQFLLGQ